MSKHSTAPWYIVEGPHDWQIRAKDGYALFGIPKDEKYGRPEEDAANVRLLLVAPEMLEGLRFAVYTLREAGVPTETIEHLFPIIEKAEGRAPLGKPPTTREQIVEIHKKLTAKERCDCEYCSEPDNEPCAFDCEPGEEECPGCYEARLDLEDVRAVIGEIQGRKP